MEHTVAWILNLEADLELADPDGFTPSARLEAKAREQGRRFLAVASREPRGARHALHAPLDRVRDAYTICQSWCPTPRARAAAEGLGAKLPDGPSLEVLRAVNHRSFALSLGDGLPGARFVRSMDELDARLAPASPGDGWLLKRPLGFSGRGRKRVAGPVRDGDRRWAEASMEQYGRGLLVEPFVRIEHEFSLHGWLARDGTLLTGDPSRMVCDAEGAWVSTETHDVELAAEEEHALRAAHEGAASALREAGYFGPFATDGYRWRDGSGLRFHPLGEINARYTMGWFAGFGDRQGEWIDKIRAEVA